jgi:very-short-patch-repair endonuclease
MSDPYKLCRFWCDEKKRFVTYEELIGMSNTLYNQRARTAELLSQAYATLRLVEHRLSDKEARLLLDIAQAIETLEEILDSDEEEQ